MADEEAAVLDPLSSAGRSFALLSEVRAYEAIANGDRARLTTVAERLLRLAPHTEVPTRQVAVIRDAPEVEDGELLGEHLPRRHALLELNEEGFYQPECTAGLLASFDASELGLRLKIEQMAGGPDADALSIASAEEAELEAIASEPDALPARRVVERFSLATPGVSGTDAQDEAPEGEPRG